MAAWTLPHRITEWCENLTTALDRRSRKYFITLMLGMVLANGRRTVSSWLRAVGVTDDWQDHYYFLQTVGRNASRLATKLLHLAVRQIPFSHVGEFIKLAIDDSPTKRYGPKVELAGIHHNPTPGPAGSEFLYGHVWVTISWLVTLPLWGCIGLPLRALMYVRRKDLQSLQDIGRAPWSFRTKLDLAAELVEWCVVLLRNWFQKRVMVIVDGAYAKRAFLSRMLKAGAVVVSRLRRDAAVRRSRTGETSSERSASKVWKATLAGTSGWSSPGLGNDTDDVIRNGAAGDLENVRGCLPADERRDPRGDGETFAATVR